MDVKTMINVLLQHVHQQLDLEKRVHGVREDQCREVIDGLAAALLEPGPVQFKPVSG